MNYAQLAPQTDAAAELLRRIANFSFDAALFDDALGLSATPSAGRTKQLVRCSNWGCDMKKMSQIETAKLSGLGPGCLLSTSERHADYPVNRVAELCVAELGHCDGHPGAAPQAPNGACLGQPRATGS